MSEENEKVYGEVTGCDSIHYALVTADNKEKYEAGVNKYLAPAAEITFDYAESLNVRHYDNVAYFMSVDDDNTKVNIIVSGVPNNEAAELLGLPYDPETGMLIETTPKPPWVALSGRMDVGDEHNMYYQFLKGKFTRSTKKANTKGSGTTHNTTDLVYTAAKTIHPWQFPDGRIGGARGISGATYDDNFTAADTWFESVQTPKEVAAAAAAETKADPTNEVTAADNAADE